MSYQINGSTAIGNDRQGTFNQVNPGVYTSNPGGAGTGDIYFNSSTKKMMAFNGSSWVDMTGVGLTTGYPEITASAADVHVEDTTDTNGYKWRKALFYTSGTLTVTSISSNQDLNIIQYFLCGGGGGGCIGSGGGGGGGVIEGQTSLSDENPVIVVTVGAGGAGGSNENSGAGGYSQVLNVRAPGGGAGRRYQNDVATNGGSGGGSNGLPNYIEGTNYPALITCQGNPGGYAAINSSGKNTWIMGGGGGAGEAGTNATSSRAGNGGRGVNGPHWARPDLGFGSGGGGGGEGGAYHGGKWTIGLGGEQGGGNGGSGLTVNGNNGVIETYPTPGTSPRGGGGGGGSWAANNAAASNVQTANGAAGGGGFVGVRWRVA